MKKIYILILILSIGLSCFGFSLFGKKKGSGYMSSKFISLKGEKIKGINLDGDFKLHIINGDQSDSIRILSDDNLLKYIGAKVKNNTLILYIKDGNIEFTNIEAYLKIRDLDLIKLKGTSLVTCTQLKLGNIKIETEDSSEFLGDNIKARNMTINSKGASYIRFSKLSLNNISINTSGVAELDMDIHANEVKLSSNEASRINLYGAANRLKINEKGASRIEAKKLKTNTCNIIGSGAGKALVNVDKMLNVNLKESSGVFYLGNPKVYKKINSNMVELEKL